MNIFNSMIHLDLFHVKWSTVFITSSRYCLSTVFLSSRSIHVDRYCLWRVRLVSFAGKSSRKWRHLMNHKLVNLTRIMNKWSPYFWKTFKPSIDGIRRLRVKKKKLKKWSQGFFFCFFLSLKKIKLFYFG